MFFFQVKRTKNQVNIEFFETKIRQLHLQNSKFLGSFRFTKLIEETL